MGEKLDKVKAHIKNHKEGYIAGATGILVGTTIGVLICKKSGVSVSTTSWKILSWKTRDIIQSTNVGNGHPGKDLLIIKGGEIIKRCSSQREASDFLEVSPGTIANHLKGMRDHVKDHQIIDLGRAA